MKALCQKVIVGIIWTFVSGWAFGFDQTFTFDLSDFTLNNQNGTISILSNNKAYRYDYNKPGYPNIPFFQYVIATDSPCDLSTLRYEILSTSVVAKDVYIQLSVPYVPTGKDIQEQKDIEEAEYLSYPESLIRLYNGPALYDNRIILTIAPFVYDKTSKNLSLVNEVRISYDEMPARKTIQESVDRNNPDNGYDYLIITQDSLAETFEELRNWKTTKGVKTEIVTLDSIANYNHIHISSINAYYIKRFINYCHAHNHIKMVLLGGTYPIVPAQSCQLEYDGEYGLVLSDMFYACLYDSLHWNGNHNVTIGEISGDGVDLTPTISVARLPIETNAQLSSYIHKLLEYERNPRRDGYLSHMLLSGSATHWYNPNSGLSDSHIESESMYINDIDPLYPHIIKHGFYDTGNDLGRTGYSAFVNPTNLSEIIEDFRPHWFNMDCHGEVSEWRVNDAQSFFAVSDANALENDSTPMVIATTACFTSDFSDDEDPCLAEAFLRHPSGGAIAYWGSSHKGWGTKYVTNSLGPSMLLCDSLWIELSKNNHFGDAVMEAKKDFLNDAYDASLPYNWLLKSMNALGDCELPIYTNEPSVFSNVFLRVVYEAVYTHPENFTIAITSKEDNGDSFFYVYPPSSNTSITSEAFTRPCNVCLTKDNFIPFVTETGRFVSANENYDLYLQNISYKSNEVCYEASNIIVGNQVDNTVETGDVVVEPGGKLDLYAFNRHIIQSGFRCKQGGQLKIGIYIEDEIE